MPTFEKNIQGNKLGAPDLSPGTFDVHGSYKWTLNENKNLRNYVPRIKLTEYKLKYSGELNSLRSTLTAITESSAAAGILTAAISQQTTNEVRNAARLGQDGGRLLANTTGGGRFNKALQTGGKILENSSKFAKDNAEAIGPLVAAGKVAVAIEGIGGATGLGVMEPYRNLYPANKTGNTYYLPYLNTGNFVDINSKWQAVDMKKTVDNLSNLATAGVGAVAEGKFGKALGGGIAEAFIKSSGELIKGLQAASQLEFALASPGASVETIKSFTPKEDGDTIAVEFFLYNTENVRDVLNNWQFLYYLTYQNLPNRRSINLLDPPCVYSVEVPGYKRFPIAVIDKLTVTNEGTTRLFDVVKGEMVGLARSKNGGQNIKMIPEAFKVSITFKSLLTSTRNLFFYSNDNNSSVINVFSDASGNVGSSAINSALFVAENTNATTAAVGTGVVTAGKNILQKGRRTP